MHQPHIAVVHYNLFKIPSCEPGVALSPFRNGGTLLAEVVKQQGELGAHTVIATCPIDKVDRYRDALPLRDFREQGVTTYLVPLNTPDKFNSFPQLSQLEFVEREVMRALPGCINENVLHVRDNALLETLDGGQMGPEILDLVYGSEGDFYTGQAYVKSFDPKTANPRTYARAGVLGKRLLENDATIQMLNTRIRIYDSTRQFGETEFGRQPDGQVRRVSLR